MLIDSFSTTSGLYFNSKKSQIFFGGIQEEVKERLNNILGFSLGNLPIKYLGVPLSNLRLKSLDYWPIFVKIIEKIQGWATSKLSYASGL